MDLIEQFITNNHIKKILQDKTNHKALSGYLFYSVDSETNRQFIKALAMGILCENNGCLNCPNCIKVKEGTHPDFIEFPKAKSFSVQDAKEIIEQANIKPMVCDAKVIVIHNIDNSSQEAQNKLLKTLEEPPKNVYFLVSATSLSNVLPTIKSRLVKTELGQFTKLQIEDIFKEHKTNPSYNLALMNGNGYIGKTLSILQNSKYLELYNLCKSIVCDLKNSSNVINFLPQKLEKQDFAIILENLSAMYRDILMLKQNQEKLVQNTLIFDNLNKIKEEFSTKALILILKKIDNANRKQFANVSVNLILQALLVNILEVKFLCK